jgi:hypothetical protein
MALTKINDRSGYSVDLSNYLTGVSRADLPAGSVLQVQYFEQTGNNNQATDGTSFVDTGVTVDITPVSANSKFVVHVNHHEVYVPDSQSACQIALYRNGTQLGDMHGGTIGYVNATLHYYQINFVYQDSPATTSTLTYKTMFRSTYSGKAVQIQADGTASRIAVFEIAG